MNTIQKLEKAMNELKVVIIDYKGDERIIEPYLLGKAKKNKNTLLRAYQIDGYSESGEVPFWKLFSFEQINDVKITDEKFTINHLYNPDDKAMGEIICRVKTGSRV